MSSPRRPDSHHAHDAFFKQVFSQLAHARELIQRYAPPEVVGLLNLDTLERMETSFVDDELKQHFADLAFRAHTIAGGETYICLLFEHKSYPERWVALQLLRYILLVWEFEHKQGRKKLPVVFPLVVYHGRQKWRVRRDLHGLVDLKDLADLARYVPSFEYHLFDLTALDDTQISGVGLVDVALGAMKHIFDARILRVIEQILQNFRAMPVDQRRAALEVVLRYIMSSAETLDKGQFVQLVEDSKYDIEAREDVMTLAQQLILEGELRGKQVGLLEGKQVGLIEGELRGKQVGLLEGKQMGLLIGRMEVALRLFRRKFKSVPDDVTRLLNHLSADQLADFGEAILDFASIDDARAWLAALLTPKQ